MVPDDLIKEWQKVIDNESVSAQLAREIFEHVQDITGVTGDLSK